jgi:hypothetical protein
VWFLALTFQCKIPRRSARQILADEFSGGVRNRRAACASGGRSWCGTLSSGLLIFEPRRSMCGGKDALSDTVSQWIAT